MNLQNDTKLPFPDLDLCFAEGGEFRMGDESGDLSDACRPVHPVKVSSFYMGKFQVTQRLWQAVMDGNPSRFIGEKRPVEQVSWLDAQEFIQKLNARQELKDLLRQLDPPLPSAAHGAFRLPTEAEWEYAARGGIHSQGYTYAGSDRLKQVGWYGENSNSETHEVGLLLPNELDIHDLSGNVWEWCNDWFDENYYEICKQQEIVENPVGPETGVKRILRGGSFYNKAVSCTPGYRRSRPPSDRIFDFSFRLCLPFQLESRPL